MNVKLNVKVCHYSSSENVRLYAKWDDESNKMYYNNTRDGLYMLDDGCNCSNVICNDSSHNTCIDDYCEKIIRILHDSTVWGCVTRSKERGKFAWSRLLDEAKRHAKRQHKIWMLSGKNRVGVEFDNMNVARREYKKELKKAKNLEKHRRCEYVESLLQKKDNMFWKNWRNINCYVRTRVNDSELANGLLCNFNSKYVNSIENVTQVNEFLLKYENYVGNGKCAGISNGNEFCIEFIEKCARELHKNRANDRNDLSAEHIIYAHPIIYNHIKRLFQLIVKHGHVPKDFKIGVIVPVVKDSRKNTADVNNYRPVTIISVMSKLFEMCVYKMINEHLKVGGMQYGFVKNGGCDKAIFAVQNVVNYYVKRHTNVYIVTLDASGAFDRVNVYALLYKLIDKNVPPEIIRVLLSWYSVSHACVRIDDIITDNIDIHSGVKQGGIMSPYMYNVYVDDLMTKLLCEKIGMFDWKIFYTVQFFMQMI